MSDVDLWSARPSLAHVHAYARARRASPAAVLGVVLARVVAATPPSVVLPPLVGGEASLNLFVGLVGRSGAGKGAATAVAQKAYDVGEIETAGAGSGEGLSHLYARRTKGGDIAQHTTAVLMDIAEIDSLTAITARTGATVLPELRKAWMGERLGFAYADPTKRLTVEAHNYRFCLVAGIQPGRAGGLLSDSDGGTPQRFLWLPATDPDAPDVAPKAPAVKRWKPPSDALYSSYRKPLVLGVCRSASKVIDAAQLARTRGEEDALDGHSLLSRLKVAAALALLDDHTAVREEDWDLAGLVMDISDDTRAEVEEALGNAEAEEHRKRGRLDAERVSARNDRLASVERVAKLILKKLPTGGAWVAHAPLRRKVAQRDREYFDRSVQRLLDNGLLEKRSVNGGLQYRAGKRPA